MPPRLTTNSLHDWCTVSATARRRHVCVDIAVTLGLMLFSIGLVFLQLFCLWAVLYGELSRVRVCLRACARACVCARARINTHQRTSPKRPCRT